MPYAIVTFETKNGRQESPDNIPETIKSLQKSGAIPPGITMPVSNVFVLELPRALPTLAKITSVLENSRTGYSVAVLTDPPQFLKSEEMFRP